MWPYNNEMTKENVDCLKERDHQDKYKRDLNYAMNNLRVEECVTNEGRWKKIKETFVKILDIIPAEEDLPVSLEAPTMGEIKKAIRTLNNLKASGPDGIPAEAMKAAQEV